MVDLDSDPTKLIEVVEIGKQLLMTRGALTTFSIANDVAKYFAIMPALFAADLPVARGRSTSCAWHSPTSAILSAVIFNADHHPAADPDRAEGRARTGPCGGRRPAAAQPADLGPGRRDRAVRRHQADRPAAQRHRPRLTGHRRTGILQTTPWPPTRDSPAARPRRPARARPGGGGARARGQLKVFFGASPGVGKTYTMLEAARAKRAEGLEWWSAWWRPTAAAETGPPAEASRSCRAATSSTAAPSRGVRPRRGARPRSPPCSWWTSWPTPTRPARATPSAGRTWRSCSTPASTSTPRSTSSTSRA